MRRTVDMLLALWLVCFAVLAWLGMTVISIAEKAHVYDMQNMPDGARAFLFPFHEYDYKRHGSFYIGASVSVCLMFLFCYIVLDMRDSDVFKGWFLVLFVVAAFNFMPLAWLNFSYSQRSGKKKSPRSSYPFPVVCHAGAEWGFRHGDELNISRLKAVLMREEGVKFARDVFNSLACEIGFEKIGLHDKGKKVKMIQRYLGMRQTGHFGLETQDAVKGLQSKLSMPQDGIFSPKIAERAVACLEVIYADYLADGVYARGREVGESEVVRTPSAFPSGMA
jgi:peptidoglycan hydrolase-like protein with peptidoglycan-binding domain